MSIADIKVDMRNVRHIDAVGLNTSIKQHTEGADISALIEAQKEVGNLLAIFEEASRALSVFKLKHAGATKEKTKLENLKSSITNKNVWSVDYTEGLSGEVNTIEVKGEPDTILVGDFTLGTSKLTEIFGQTVAGSLYNFALTPYWQKWNPTFRIGTITAISGSTASVTLDAATSHYQNLNINQSKTLTDVTFSYLDCGSGAFIAGDEVIVAFTSQDWSTPIIIGFKDNPLDCTEAPGCTIWAQYLDGAVYRYKGVNWGIADVGGQSPSISFQYPYTAPDSHIQDIPNNAIQNYVTGVFKITASIALYGTIEITIECTYNNPDWRIGVKFSCPELTYDPTPINPKAWPYLLAGGSRTPPTMSVDTGSPGYKESYSPPFLVNIYRDAWIYYTGYTEGVIFFNLITRGLSGAGVDWHVISETDLNPKRSLGV